MGAVAASRDQAAADQGSTRVSVSPELSDPELEGVD
jgi:hypothetical protein